MVGSTWFFKALRSKDAKYIVAPKYKELSVAKLWSYVLAVLELNQYFPTMNESELPERDYMWTVIFSINSEATTKFIKDARKSRTSPDTIDQNELLEVDPAIFKEIIEIVEQKLI